MHKIKLWVPVLVGLIAGQLFAAGERPFKVVNTIRVGYSDNIDRTADKEAGSFVTDIIDLSFRAALSDRTDVMVKSQLNILTESNQSPLQPNLYVMLNHSISPRLLLRLSEYYRSGDKTGGDVNTTNATKNTRYNYFFNRMEASADYVLTEKDRLTASVDHSMYRNDKEINYLDYTAIGENISWRRELVPQRTFSTISLRHTGLLYDEISRDQSDVAKISGITVGTNQYSFLDQNGYDLVELTAGLSHTFNPSWQAYFDAGVAYKQPSYSDYLYTFTSTNGTTTGPTLIKSKNTTQFLPVFSAGVVYSPSPVTRLTADFGMSFTPSDDSGHNGQSTRDITFGAQHQITAKLMAKATARFSSVQYSEDDSKTPTETTNGDETRMDLDLRLTYKLNRMHFLEAGVMHRQTDRDAGNSWDENRVDVGWRVELN